MSIFADVFLFWPGEMDEELQCILNSPRCLVFIRPKVVHFAPAAVELLVTEFKDVYFFSVKASKHSLGLTKLNKYIKTSKQLWLVFCKQKV